MLVTAIALSYIGLVFLIHDWGKDEGYKEGYMQALDDMGTRVRK